MNNVNITLLICMEFYRTPDQTYTADDYIVDGIKILRLPAQFEQLPDDNTEARETIKALCLEIGKDLVSSTFAKFPKLSKQYQARMRRDFPKAVATYEAGTPHWFHVTTDTALAHRPQEFHGNGFSEAELLGATDADEDITDKSPDLSVYLNSVGDEIEAPPDKFMLSIGAA